MIWDCSITITITLPISKWQVDLPKIHISLSILLWFIFLANLISSGQTIWNELSKVKAKICAVYTKAISFSNYFTFCDCKYDWQINHNHYSYFTNHKMWFFTHKTNHNLACDCDLIGKSVIGSQVWGQGWFEECENMQSKIEIQRCPILHWGCGLHSLTRMSLIIKWSSYRSSTL